MALLFRTVSARPKRTTDLEMASVIKEKSDVRMAAQYTSPDPCDCARTVTEITEDSDELTDIDRMAGAGSTEGALVGCPVGCPVGFLVGLRVGAVVGLADGKGVGIFLVYVGARVGETVGRGDGLGDGF